MGESGQIFEYSVRDGVCAVYLLSFRGKVVYVGQSLNVFTRIGQHHQHMVRGRKGLPPYRNGGHEITVVIFDHVQIKPCLKRDLEREELALIQQHLPCHNKLMKREANTEKYASLRKLPGYQELIKKTEVSQLRMKKRKLPSNADRAEQDFRTYRDREMRVTLPKLKCLEDELTG